MLNILICDNQLLTSEGLTSILSATDGIHIAGKAKNTTELGQLIDKAKPAVIIIDPYLGDSFSTDDIKNIQKEYALANILVLSDKQDREEILELIKQGVRHYVSKKCTREEIVLAVYATSKGEQFYCKNTLHILFENQLPDKDNDAITSLSVRESEIIQLISAGMTNKEIAEKLFLSIHTIKTHRKNIIKKLGFTFKNAADLMLYAAK